MSSTRLGLLLSLGGSGMACTSVPNISTLSADVCVCVCVCVCGGVGGPYLLRSILSIVVHNLYGEILRASVMLTHDTAP